MWSHARESKKKQKRKTKVLDTDRSRRGANEKGWGAYDWRKC